MAGRPRHAASAATTVASALRTARRGPSRRRRDQPARAENRCVGKGSSCWCRTPRLDPGAAARPREGARPRLRPPVRLLVPRLSGPTPRRGPRSPQHVCRPAHVRPHPRSARGGRGRQGLPRLAFQRHHRPVCRAPAPHPGSRHGRHPVGSRRRATAQCDRHGSTRPVDGHLADPHVGPAPAHASAGELDDPRPRNLPVGASAAGSSGKGFSRRPGRSADRTGRAAYPPDARCRGTQPRPVARRLTAGAPATSRRHDVGGRRR
jgi:hypothetical protein